MLTMELHRQQSMTNQSSEKMDADGSEQNEWVCELGSVLLRNIGRCEFIEVFLKGTECVKSLNEARNEIGRAHV